MVARGRLTMLKLRRHCAHSLKAHRRSSARLSLVLELSFSSSNLPLSYNKKALKRGLFCYGSEGEIRTLDTRIMIPLL